MAKNYLALALIAGLLFVAKAHSERIKDIASVQGVRSNQLIGYGLIVGLDGSGDQTTQTPFTTQALTTMLSQLGITMPPGTNLQLKNVAAVMATATLPPFAQPGQQLDVTVSSLGNAKSLRGGTLLLTSLKGADGQIYALAQGNVIVGGAGASAGGSKTQINHLSAGRVPNGATVERAVPSQVGQGEYVQFELHATNFGTARKMADVINGQFGNGVAHALDGRVVRVLAPTDSDQRVAFLAQVESLPVEIAPPAAKIIINARTGSIVMNRMVTLEPCAVAHGNLTVTINSDPVISQPAPLSQGQTVLTEKAQIQIKQDSGSIIAMPAGAKLDDVVKALNQLGATPQDLLAVLQAMQAAGALRAELEVI